MPILFKTDIASDADLKVYVTDIRSDADLAIYETTSQWEVSSSVVWYYSSIRSEAKKAVYFASSKWDADLIIFRTQVQSDAAWINSGKSHLI